MVILLKGCVIMKKIIWIFICLMAFALIKNVSAYIGPGTGSIIANTLWPLIVTVSSVILIFSSKYLWKLVKNVFSKLIRAVKKRE